MNTYWHYNYYTDAAL